MTVSQNSCVWVWNVLCKPLSWVPPSWVSFRQSVIVTRKMTKTLCRMSLYSRHRGIGGFWTIDIQLFQLCKVKRPTEKLCSQLPRVGLKLSVLTSDYPKVQISWTYLICFNNSYISSSIIHISRKNSHDFYKQPQRSLQTETNPTQPANQATTWPDRQTPQTQPPKQTKHSKTKPKTCQTTDVIFPE